LRVARSRVNSKCGKEGTAFKKKVANSEPFLPSCNSHSKDGYHGDEEEEAEEEEGRQEELKSQLM
jgi:hypothetical protein